MSTLPPPETKTFPEDSLEKKIYTFVETLDKYVPVPNDRNRLAYNLYKFMTGQGDDPAFIVNNQKLEITGITQQELTKKITDGLSELKHSM